MWHCKSLLGTDKDFFLSLKIYKETNSKSPLKGVLILHVADEKKCAAASDIDSLSSVIFFPRCAVNI